MKNQSISKYGTKCFTLIATMALVFSIHAKKPPVDEKKPIDEGKVITHLKYTIQKDISGVEGIDLNKGKIIIDLKKVTPVEIRLENGEVLDLEAYLKSMEDR